MQSEGLACTVTSCFTIWNLENSSSRYKDFYPNSICNTLEHVQTLLCHTRLCGLFSILCIMAPHSGTLAWKTPMDGGAWWAAVHAVARSRTWLRDFTLTFHFHALEKEMATHSSVLAWRIRETGEPGGLLSMGSHRVGHDWSDLAAVAAGKTWPDEASTTTEPQKQLRIPF